MSVHLSFAYNFWLVILGVLTLCVFVWWGYRTTTPPVSETLRRSLLALRVLSMVFLFCLLFQPILAIISRKVEKPVVAVLVDTSSSMQLTDSVGTRAAHLKQLFSQPWWRELQKRYEIFTATFADTTRATSTLNPDSLVFDGDGTNLLSPLTFAKEKLARKNFAAALLFSDGVHNIGGDPGLSLQNFPAPVYTVGLGKNTPEKDLWLADVITNEVAFADTKVPVEIIVRSTGFATQQVNLTIRQEQNIVASQPITLPRDLEEQKVHLEFVPKQAGTQKYTASVENLAGEITQQNNTRTFYVKVLRSKLNIAVVALAPSPDFSFLLRALESDKNLSVKSFIAIGANKLLDGALPTAAEMRKIDCVVAVNATAAPPGNGIVATWLRAAVIDAKKPLLFLSGNPATVAHISGYRDLIFLASTPVLSPPQQVLPAPTLQGLVSPIMRVNNDESTFRETWEALPPMFSAFQKLQFLPNAQVLAHAKSVSGAKPGSSQVPLIVALRQGERKTIALMGSGFWRWNLMMQRILPGNDLYSRFLLNSIRWLVSTEDTKLLKVATNKDIYRTGEEIVLTAQAYYEDFTPRDNLEISVRVDGPELARDFVLEGKGRGLYEGRLQVLAGGDYRLQAEARDGGVAVSSDQGKFTVEPFQIEFQKTLADRDELEKIARVTGGTYIPADSLDTWQSNATFRERVIVEESQTALWRNTPMLFLLVFLLSTEWFIRKRKGMF